MENAQTPDKGKKSVETTATKPATSPRKPAAARVSQANRVSQAKSSTATPTPSATRKPAAKKPAAPKTPAVKSAAATKAAETSAAALAAASSKVASAKPTTPRTTAPKATSPKATAPEPIAAPAEKSKAEIPQSAEKPDAVLVGLARLRALAAQFTVPAPTATPAPAPELEPDPTAEQAPEQRPKPQSDQKSESAGDGVVAVQSTISHALEATSTDIVLKVRGLSKGFGDTVAVNDIDLNVRAGVFYGIVGPNGAGKTTTLSMITGLLRPDSGTASVNGIDVWDSPEIAKRSMGVLPDRLRIFDRLTGSQLLYYSGVLRGLNAAEVRKRSADLATAFGLDDVMGRLVSDYSSGMLKKVALAAAMIHSPRLLVLDEPFESVDPVSAATVTRILKQYVNAGGTVLLSSHRMELVQRVCSHVAVIVEGTLLANGTIDEVRNGMSLEDRFVQLTGKNSSGGGLEWLSSFSD